MESSDRITARRSGLVTKDVGDEVVVYDLETDKVHLLNATTSAIWRFLDDRDEVPVAEAVEVAAAVAGGDSPDELARIAIEELRTNGLIESSSPPLTAGIDRRRMLKLVGAAAVAGPMITTILAPTAAATHSPGAPFPDGSGTCSPAGGTGNVHCASGNCGADGICGTCKALHASACGAGSNRCCTNHGGACTTVGTNSYCCNGNGVNGTAGPSGTCCSGTASGGVCVCTPPSSVPNVPQSSLCCSPATKIKTTTGACCFPTGTTDATITAAGFPQLGNNDTRCCSNNTTGSTGSRSCTGADL